jgi:hypothetical protein
MIWLFFNFVNVWASFQKIWLFFCLVVTLELAQKYFVELCPKMTVLAKFDFEKKIRQKELIYL